MQKERLSKLISHPLSTYSQLALASRVLGRAFPPPYIPCVYVCAYVCVNVDIRPEKYMHTRERKRKRAYKLAIKCKVVELRWWMEMRIMEGPW